MQSSFSDHNGNKLLNSSQKIAGKYQHILRLNIYMHIYELILKCIKI
jgi:hypothetical protein